MNNPSLESVATFLKVVETGGFAAAARELGVTQSTVSRRVSELERQLGSKLLERTTRRVMLTEPGLRYSEAAQVFLRGLAEAGANLGDESLSAKGPLRISAPLGYGRKRVLPALVAFSELNPLVRFDIDLSDRYVDILKENYDFSVRLAEPQESGVAAKVIGWVNNYVCATPKFLRDNSIKTSDDLKIDKCLVQRTYAPHSTWTITQDGVLKHLQLQPKMVLNGIYAIHEMTLAGMGVAILPDFLADDDFSTGRLTRVSDSIAVPPRPVCLAWPRHKTNLPRVRALREFLEAFLDETQPPNEL
jgi:DNA-binding transcriptional LysR family regulator